MNSSELLIIFTKNPVLGKCKTRLAKTIGNEEALEVYRSLLRHTARITAPLDVVKKVYYSDRVNPNDMWNEAFYKKEQSGNDLGERMQNAFKEGFQQGFRRIVIIGTDLFDLSTENIEEAFDKLKSKNYILGPAEDGGYYLLGMKELYPALFQNKKWSTPSVLPDTLSDLKNKSYALLKEKNDIDTYEDLKASKALAEEKTPPPSMKN